MVKGKNGKEKNGKGEEWLKGRMVKGKNGKRKEW